MTTRAVGLGQAIREIRKLRGLTQREVADQAAITITYLSLLESGKRGVSDPTLETLAGVLEVPPLFIRCLGVSADDEKDPGRRRILEQIKNLIKAALKVDTEAKQ
jgi:transcriptional regulator with XRE-family HTH domain